MALLNHYVDSAALRHNFLPYLVRLQIAVTPTVAREPYDVLSRISFFARPRPDAIEAACRMEKGINWRLSP